MSENEIVEIAKATSEVAKTGGKAIDATSAFGQFCDRVFGEGLVQGFGIVSDRVKYARIKQAIKLEEEVTKLLENAGVQKTQPVSPVVALPIFESATLEEDEDLHTAWANLLATAMDPSKPNMKRSFAGILKELEPFDVRLFRAVMGVSASKGHNRDLRFVKRKLEAKMDGTPNVEISSSEKGGGFISISDGEDQGLLTHKSGDPKSGSSNVEVSLLNLVRLGLLAFGYIENPGMNFGGYALTVFRGIEEVSVTALGLEFYAAVAT